MQLFVVTGKTSSEAFCLMCLEEIKLSLILYDSVNTGLCLVSKVKPVLSGLSIKRTVAENPKFISLIYCMSNLPPLSGRGHLKST